MAAPPRWPVSRSSGWTGLGPNSSGYRGKSARDTRPSRLAEEVASRKARLDGGHHRRIVGRGPRAEPLGDRAIRTDHELLEVPQNVAGLAVSVRRLREQRVDGMPAGPVDLDLGEHRERDPVGRRTELGDLLGRT